MDAQTTAGASRSPVSTAEVIEGLNDLIRLDHDAIGAYGIAIEKLKDRDHADQIAGFRRDHERHIRDLQALVAELGGTPADEPHATAPLKQALQRLGAAAGDRGLLVAWRTNELQVRTKYDAYAARANAWPVHVKRAIDQNALDEERHFAWVTQVLDRLGVPTAEGLETGAATRVREAGVQMENLAHQASNRVRDTAGELAAGARNRVADGLDAAGERLEHMVEERAAPGDRADRAGHRVASGMHGGARYVRNADLSRVRDDLERSAREHPMRTLGVLFATGFVIGRLLR